MNLFNLSLRLKGFPIVQAKQDLIIIQNKNNEDYRAYLEQKKREIVEYHLKYNAFYKSFVNDINTSEWKNIPVLTKVDLQIPLNDKLSKGFTKKKCHLHKTSGSSGTPLIFAKDKYCHAITWANFMDRYAWYDIHIDQSKQARFYGIPLTILGNFKERFKDFISNRFRFSVFDLSTEKLEKNITRIKRTKFDYINGYTSAIIQFAKFLKKKNIVLKTICPALKACIVTAEMLFEDDKTLLESQLGIPVINEYGSAELGLIAFQNKKNEWVINSEDLFVEILDANDNPVPNGNEGRIVITALYNKANPFIRYDLGDIGAFSPLSTPRKPILNNLKGRTNDIIELPSGNKAAGLTFYYVTKTVIEDNSNVKEFIIEQFKLDTFKISYVSQTVLPEEKLLEIQKAISKYLEPNLNILFERRKALDRTNNGKIKQFNSYL